MLEFIAEQRIAEAIAKGELENLPGTGRPLELDDDRLVPEELRVAYRILKNAGCLPPELETAEELTAANKLAVLEARVERRYYAKVVARLG
jgi:hypothetical protein